MTTAPLPTTPQMNTFKTAYDGVKQQYPTMYQNSMTMLEQVGAAGIDCRIYFRCWSALSHTSSEQQLKKRYASVEKVKTEYEAHKATIQKFLCEIDHAITAFNFLSEDEKIPEVTELDDEGNSDLHAPSHSSECVSKHRTELLQFKMFFDTLQTIMFSYEDTDPHGFIQSFHDCTTKITVVNKGLCETTLPSNDSAPPELQKYNQLIDEAQKHLEQHLQSLKMLATATLTMHVFNRILAQDKTLLLNEANSELQKYEERKASYTLYQQEHKTLATTLKTTIDHLSYLQSDASKAALALLKDQLLLNEQLSHRFAIVWQGKGDTLKDTLLSKTHTLYFTNAYKELSTTVKQSVPQKPQEPVKEEASTSFFTRFNPFAWGASSSTDTTLTDPKKSPQQPQNPPLLTPSTDIAVIQAELQKTQDELSTIKALLLEQQGPSSSTNIEDSSDRSEELGALKQTITLLSAQLASFPEAALSTLNAVDAYTKIKSLNSQVWDNEGYQPEDGAAFITNAQDLMQELNGAKDELLLAVSPQINELAQYINSLIRTSSEDLSAPLGDMSLSNHTDIPTEIPEQDTATITTTLSEASQLLKSQVLDQITNILQMKDANKRTIALQLSKAPFEQEQFQELLNSIRINATQVPAPVLKEGKPPTPTQLVAQAGPVLKACQSSLPKLNDTLLNEINAFCEQITRLSVITVQPSSS